MNYSISIMYSSPLYFLPSYAASSLRQPSVTLARRKEQLKDEGRNQQGKEEGGMEFERSNWYC